VKVIAPNTRVLVCPPMRPARRRTVLLTGEDSAAMLASTACVAVALLDCIAIPTPGRNDKKAQMTQIQLLGTYHRITHPDAATTSPLPNRSHGGTFTTPATELIVVCPMARTSISKPIAALCRFSP